MAGYPYNSPPPPSPPCNDTTPALPPPPPPPPPACNHTTTPTLPRPPPTACACNKTSPTLPPPASPPPHSSYYSPPLASMSSPPPPPSTRYSPPSHSPPPSSHPPPASPPPPPFYYSPPLLPPPSSDYSPPPPSQSPPKPSNASPPPLLQPTKPPPAPSPYYSPQTPLHPPLAPNPPLCHCVCPSPWATPPSYYPSIAPSPQFLSPSNGHRTVVLTTFVSLGGVFFLAFITIGLLSMAIRKRMPSMPTMGQPDNSHVEGQGHIHNLEQIPSRTSIAQSVINIDPVQTIVPPDQGAGHVVKEGEILQTMSTDKISSNPDMERQTFEDITESDDPKKRLSQRKPSVTDSSQGMDLGDQEKGDDSNEELSKSLGDQTVPDNTDAPQDADKELNADEEKSDDCNRKPIGDQSAPENATEQESKVEDESNDSRKKLRPKKNPFNSRKGNSKGKQGGKKPSGVGQAMNAAMRVFQCGQEYEDAESDEGKVQEVHQDAVDESNTNEEKSGERTKPFGDQSVTTDKADINPNESQESSAVEGKSNDSRENLCSRMKNPSGDPKSKQGGKKPSGAGQAVNAAMRVFKCGQEYEDAERDEGKVQEVPQDAVDESNANEEKSDERNPKPFGDQSVKTDNADINQNESQESSAVEGNSNDSREYLRSRMKNTSGDPKSKQGGKKPSGAGQAVNAAMRVFKCGQEYEDAESDEGKVQEVPQDVVDESNANKEKSDERNPKPFGDQIVTTDNADIDQDVYQESSAVEGKSNDSRKNLRSHMKNPSGGLKSKPGGKKPSGVGQAVNAPVSVYQYGVVESQDDDNDQREVHAPQDAEHESNANEDELEEPNCRPLINQTETENIDAEDVEQEPGTVEEESKDSKEQLRPGDKNPSSDRYGKQGERKSFKLRQAVSAVTNLDLDEAAQPQDDDKDEGELHEAEPQDHDEKLKSSGSNKDLCGRQLRTQARANKEPSILDKIVSTTKNDDPDVKLESPKEEDGEEKLFRGRKELPNLLTVASGDYPGEELESFGNPDDEEEESEAYSSNKDLHRHKSHTSAPGRKEFPSLSKKISTTIVVDPNMEHELLVDAKEEKSVSFGSKIDSRLHKRQSGARGRRDPRNDAQIWSAPLGSDPSTCFKSIADDDEKEEKEDQGMEWETLIDDGAKEEGELFGLTKVTYLPKRQIGTHGRKGPPNISQVLNIPTGGDGGVNVKFLADDDEKDTGMEWESLVDGKQKKLELFGRKEVSRLHKRQIGDGARKEPAPNLGQILTSKTVSDAGVELKSVSTHWRGQKEASNISESMTLRNDVDPSGELESHDDDGQGDPNVTATYEGDPIADLEFHEDDEELESECSNKGLGLLKLHARSLGETEFSTDDQSVFLTVDDDPDVLLQSHNDEHDEEPAESGKVARSGKPLSRPRTTGIRGKRRT